MSSVRYRCREKPSSESDRLTETVLDDSENSVGLAGDAVAGSAVLLAQHGSVLPVCGLRTRSIDADLDPPRRGADADATLNSHRACSGAVFDAVHTLCELGVARGGAGRGREVGGGRGSGDLRTDDVGHRGGTSRSEQDRVVVDVVEEHRAQRRHAPHPALQVLVGVQTRWLASQASRRPTPSPLVGSATPAPLRRRPRAARSAHPPAPRLRARLNAGWSVRRGPLPSRTCRHRRATGSSRRRGRVAAPALEVLVRRSGT